MAKLWAVELLETTNHTNKHEKGRGAMQRLVKPSWRCVFKSLHKRACTGLLNRIAHSLRERPCFSRLARDEKIAKNWLPEKERGTPGLPGWRVFLKDICELACEGIFKKAATFAQRINPVIFLLPPMLRGVKGSTKIKA